MAIVTINFDYKLPNEYLSSDDSNGLVGNIDYVGPEAFYVFVDKATGLRDVDAGVVLYTSEADTYEAQNQARDTNLVPVKVIASRNPILASVVIGQEYPEDYPVKEYRLDGDDTVYYRRPDPLWPNHVYENAFVYNFSTETWNTPEYLKPHITFDQWNAARETLEQGYREQLESDTSLSDEQKAALSTYIDALNELETKFAGWEPWQIPFPEYPEILIPAEPEESYSPTEEDFDPDAEGIWVDPDAPPEPAPDNGPIPVT